MAAPTPVAAADCALRLLAKEPHAGVPKGRLNISALVEQRPAVASDRRQKHESDDRHGDETAASHIWIGWLSLRSSN